MNDAIVRTFREPIRIAQGLDPGQILIVAGAKSDVRCGVLIEEGTARYSQAQADKQAKRPTYRKAVKQRKPKVGKTAKQTPPTLGRRRPTNI